MNLMENRFQFQLSRERHKLETDLGKNQKKLFPQVLV